MKGVKTITDFGVLMRLASQLGKARISGDQKQIAEAQLKHDTYRDLCLKSDEMSINMIVGQLQNVSKGK